MNILRRLLPLLLLITLPACPPSGGDELPEIVSGDSVRHHGYPQMSAANDTSPNHCAASGGQTSYEYIDDVLMFPIPSTDLMVVLVSVFIVNPGACTAGNPCPEYDNSPEYVNGWIDWNDDGVFSPAEMIMDQAGTGYANINYTGTMSFLQIVPIPDGSVAVPWTRFNLGWDYDRSSCPGRRGAS